MKRRLGSFFLLILLPWLPILAFTATLASDAEPTCTTQQCVDPEAWKREQSQLVIDGQVATITEGRDCWTDANRYRMPRTFIVRNSAQDKAGDLNFDTTVVREVEFDLGWELALEGEVWVLGFCA